jgi:hypothetical protein
MVADDIKRFKRSRLPPKPLLPYAGLPEERRAIITINNISMEKKVTKS